MTGTDTLAPVAVRERALAPDLARGAMLLLIALANVHVWLSSHPLGYRGYPRPESVGALDRVVAGVQLVLVDGRAYPLFGLLFGYGCVQLARGLLRRGVSPDGARRLLRRRGWWLVAIGAAHGVLLFPGDIAAAYGVLAVLLAGVVLTAVATGRDRPLRVVAICGLAFTTVSGLALVLPPPEGTTALLPSAGTDSPLLALLLRVPEWLGIGLAYQVLGVGAAVAVGAAAARLRLLEEPERHRALLVRLAAGGLALAVLGGLPLALVGAGAVDPSPGLLLVSGALHSLTGYAGGVGYAALFALVALRSSRDGAPGPLVRALSACGQRSLTCYLGQSVVFAALLPRWSLGLGATLGVAQASLLAVATWAALVAAAVAMARVGRRGPAEVLLRRLTYRG